MGTRTELQVVGNMLLLRQCGIFNYFLLCSNQWRIFENIFVILFLDRNSCSVFGLLVSKAKAIEN